MSDYIKKSANNKVHLYSGLPEFGYELISTLPYAYNLYLRGELESTCSGFDTRCFYFFSPKHTEELINRSYENCRRLAKNKFPNIDIHRNRLDWGDFTPPPLRDHFKAKAITFSKPSIILSNRVNNEWGGGPLNYLCGETVIALFEMLHKQYQIVYIDSSYFGGKYEDHEPFKKEFVPTKETFEKYEVVSFLDLVDTYPDVSLNELQCRLYAGSERFISSNGGFGILASYFGGENIIFSKQCQELDPEVNSFQHWYANFSKATITVVRDEHDLLERIKLKWVNNAPLFNVLIRTSGRPNYFHDAIRSVVEQSYDNVNIVVGVDDPDSIDYITGHPCTIVEVDRHTGPVPIKPDGEEYGVFFPYNSYFNKLLEYVKSGYVIYLDDDDCFKDTDALKRLSTHIAKGSFDSIFWRVRFPDRLVPSDENWEKHIPVCRDVSTVGFCHRADIVPDWEPWKRGDYRAAKHVYKCSKKTLWLNEVLTGLQRTSADGYGKRDDKNEICSSANPPMAVVITAYKSSGFLERCVDSIVTSCKLLGVPFRVLVGIDGCSETRSTAVGLVRKYGSKVEFYFSKDNLGTYMIRNSLLEKIVRRDSVVLFFDSDDVAPPNFLSFYYGRIQKLASRNAFKGVMKVRCLEIEEKLLADAAMEPNPEAWLNPDFNLKDQYDTAIVKTAAKILKDGSMDYYGDILTKLIRFSTINNRRVVNNEFQSVIREPHGVFFTSFTSLERLGFFNEYRVGQDTDFVNRSKIVFKSMHKFENGAYFLRSIHSKSLTSRSDCGHGSNFRRDIIKKNKKLISEGKIVAPRKSITIAKVL